MRTSTGGFSGNRARRHLSAGARELLKGYFRDMGKMACPCGNVLSNVADPNDVEWTLIANRKLDDCDLSTSATKVVDRVYDEGFAVWRCECGRLAVLSEIFPDRATWFKPS